MIFQILIFFMIPNKYRRKRDIVKTEKQTYSKHILCLEELKSGWSPSIKKKIQQERKLKKIISKVHQIHERSRKHEFTSRNKTQQTIKKKNPNRVKSVIKDEFDRQLLIIPPKHKRRDDHILVENEKMYERIIKTKAKVSNDNARYTERLKHQLPSISENIKSISKIYENSKLNDFFLKEIKLKLKKKYDLKLTIKLDKQTFLNLLKDKNQLYFLQAKHGSAKQRSGNFILQELVQFPISIFYSKKGKKDIVLQFYRLFDEKELFRGEIRFSTEELMELVGREQKLVKDVYCWKDKKLGSVCVKVQVKQRKGE